MTAFALAIANFFADANLARDALFEFVHLTHMGRSCFLHWSLIQIA